ncbi:hypothetical protein [Parasphingorhabdus halotolerans]|nr:hypothetical protein [Parasphingorhabdus halotolerans]
MFALIAMLIAVTAMSRIGFKNVSDFLPIFYFRRQDVWLAAILLFCWLKFASYKSAEGPKSFGSLSNFGEYRYAPALVAIALFIFCTAGHFLVLGGYHASRDEQMAVFDAIIFADGRLVWPIAEQWRSMAPALNQLFILPIGTHEAWVSAYLPVNAAVRAIFGFLGSQSFASPFFVAIGAVALWKIARILWPDRRDVAWLCLILYAGSGQVLVTGMTAYAMNGHLGLNMLWLWLFLLNRRRTDCAALIVGFLATGMHQPLFHPLFAAPILAILVLRRDWQRVAVYLLGYAVICLFWLYWPIAISNLAQTSATETGAGLDYLTRLTDAIGEISFGGVMLMLANIFRFVAWQHLLLIPLAMVGIHTVLKAKDRFATALAVSLILPIPVLLLLLPYQGHGFGYRYLHPVLGNAIILAGYAWKFMDPDDIWTKQTGQKLLVTTSAITFGLLVPLQLYFAHSFYAPWAAVDRAIAESKVDIALIDSTAAPFAADLVFNHPELSTKPLRLDARLLSAEDMIKVCGKGPSVLLVGADATSDIARYFGRALKSDADTKSSLGEFGPMQGCRTINAPEPLKQ